MRTLAPPEMVELFSAFKCPGTFAYGRTILGIPRRKVNAEAIL
jgi:hypothetical protein